jgi:hypothetical protein
LLALDGLEHAHELKGRGTHVWPLRFEGELPHVGGVCLGDLAKRLAPPGLDGFELGRSLSTTNRSRLRLTHGRSSTTPKRRASSTAAPMPYVGEPPWLSTSAKKVAVVEGLTFKLAWRKACWAIARACPCECR